MYGDALLLIRKYHNLKQHEMALRLAVAPNYLTIIEKNRRDTPLILLKSYATFLDVKMWSLLAFIEALSVEDHVDLPPMCDKMWKIYEWGLDVREYKKTHFD